MLYYLRMVAVVVNDDIVMVTFNFIFNSQFDDMAARIQQVYEERMLKIKRENEERIQRLQKEKEEAEAAAAAAAAAIQEQSVVKDKSNSDNGRSMSVVSKSSKLTKSAELSKDE
jgi:low affinity Fe/Cu permease